MDEFENEYAELASLYQKARSTAKTPEGRRMAQADYDEAVRDVARRQQSTQRMTQPTAPSTPSAAPLSTGEKIAGTARAFGQGVSFGFGEELEAGVRSLASGRPYGEEVGALRQSMSRFREAQPKTALAAEIGGGLLVPGLGMARTAATGARAGMTGAKALGAMTRSAAAQGALTGAGTAEGGLGNRAIGAGIGGLLGGTTGYLLGRATGAGVAGTTRMTQGASPLAPAGIGEVVERAQMAGISDLPQAIARAGRSGAPGTTVMDVLGTPGVRLASGIRTIGGEAGNVVEGAMQQRLATTPQRLQQAVFSTGRRAENVVEAVDDLISARDAASRPLYDLALGTVDPNTMQRTATPIVSDKIESYLGRPLFQRAVNLARESIENRGGKLATMDTPQGPVPVRTPEFLDNVKKALDDIIYKGRQPGEGGFGPTALREAKLVRKEFVDLLDDNIPGYAQARAAFAGPTALKDALEAGAESGARRVNPEVLAKEVSEYSANELEFFQRGYINSMRQQIDEGLLKPAQVRTPAFTQRLQAVFGAEGDQVVSAIRQQVELGENAQRILNSSRTAERRQDVAELTGATRAGDVARAFLRPRESMLNALSAVESRATTPLFAARRLATAQTLMTPATQSDAIRASLRRENLARVLGTATRNIVGPATGRLAASQVMNSFQNR